MASGMAYLGSPEHTQDIANMASTPGAQLAPRIISYEANADEVMEWYGSDDPCNEELNWKLVRNRASPTYSPFEDRLLTAEMLSSHFAVNESAALTLLLSTAGISEGGAPGKPWTKAGYPEVVRAMSTNPDMFARNLINASMQQPDLAQFDKLYVAADSLRFAASALHYFSIEGNAGRLPVPNHEDFFKRSRQYKSDVIRLGSLMLTHIDRQDRETQVASRSMMHRVGVMMVGVSMEDDFCFTDDPESSELTDLNKRNFNYLTELINYSYLDLDESKVVKGGAKGDLHELLFLLDTNFLFSGATGKDKLWHVAASSDRHDKPKIGYPSKNRGLDFTASNGNRSRLLQIKSSQKDKTEYHPWILKLEETNLQEVDKRRLGSKIKAYQAWIASDFSPELRPQVEKYIIDSARDAYDAIIADAKLPESQRIIQTFASGLSRAEKRRIMRNSGDFKKRNTKK
ncbi:MAG: hypothetical protein WBK76_05775 [Candidatus Saccharimonadales bacterium]